MGEEYKCHECGTTLTADEVEFCPYCGKPLCPDCFADHEENCPELDDEDDED